MSAMQILSAEVRLAEPRGSSIVLAGPSGIGKTPCLRTLDPARTLVIDADRGSSAPARLPRSISFARAAGHGVRGSRLSHWRR